MRWLAWVMLMAIALGVGAAGLNSEFNPVLRQPHHASVENATGRVIVKFRPANSSPQRAKLQSTQDRISALIDRKSTRLNSSHRTISYAVFCLKKKKKKNRQPVTQE